MYFWIFIKIDFFIVKKLFLENSNYFTKRAKLFEDFILDPNTEVIDKNTSENPIHKKEENNDWKIVLC